MIAVTDSAAGQPSDRPPVRASRIFEEICGQIRAMLAKGELKPGDKLPPERDLAVQFGASRTAVREALRGLEIAGLVELHLGVKGGAFIRQGDPAVVTRSISDMVSLGRISLESLTESRVLVLDSVVRLASERAGPEDFEALGLSIDRTEQLTREGRTEERRQQLLAFYRLLARSTRNEVMAIMVDAITDIVLQVMARDDAAPKPETVRAHREILKALSARDASKAASLMRAHLVALHEHLFEAQAKMKAKASASAAAPARSRGRR